MSSSPPMAANALLALGVVLVSCFSPQATPPATATPSLALVATPTSTATPRPTPTPTPTTDPDIAQVAQLLAARDEAQRTGDEAALLAILDPGAAPELRERELTLLRMAKARAATPPARQLLRRTQLDPLDAQIQAMEVVESDDQGRVRRMRYFANFACCTRLTEPTPATIDRWLGPVKTKPAEGFTIRYRDADADQAAVAEAFAHDALTSLVTRLGEAYRAHRPFTITLAPTTIAGLPAPASGFADGNEVTILSSQTVVVASGPGSEWARSVVTHEIAHVLLFARGGGPWVMVEGIPLWLTDDRRQPELDRLVKAKAIWDLDHLLAGPRDVTEFFAGYAQASSFVRYLAARFGDRAVIAAWEGGRAKPTFDDAFRAAFGVAPADAWADWRATLGPA